MQNKSKSSLFIIAIITLFYCFSFSSLHAEGGTGIYTINLSDTKFIIVDTNSKKMLVYNVGSKGLLLKEVRSFESALDSENFTSPKGLTTKEERAYFTKKDK